MAAVTASDPGGLLLRCRLPEPLVELPETAEHEVDEVASRLADTLFAGLTDEVRAAVVDRYRAALRVRTATGTGVVAMVQARGPLGVTASMLTVRLVPSDHDDAQVAAAGLHRALHRAGPSGAEVAIVALPAGPGVLRLRHRELLADGPDGQVEVPLALLELLVPLPGLRAMAVLDLVCPTPDDLPRHTALAGTVAASLRVDAGVADPREH